MSVKEYVKQLSVRSGETHRGMCPTCGGSNTFTATNLNGTVKYNCYKASCNVYGALYKGATLNDLTRQLDLKLGSIDSKPVVFELPECCILPTSGGVDRAFMERYLLTKPYDDGRIALRYDCKQHRLVFLVTDPLTGMTVDAVGRALEQGVKPKWLRYGTHPNAMLYVPPASTLLTTLSKSVDTAGCVVLVEDAISACTVSDIIASIALLGTNVPQSLLSVLRGLGTKTVIVALDPDAASKSIDIQRQLCYYFDTKVWLIKDDLKYYTRGRLIEEVGELLT